MPMNVVIQEKRKELGLTQEQVAGYLGVSTPAVSKWETGATSPDISLLPALARLLKTDLNTLFGFREELSEQDIGHFCGELKEIVRTEGIGAAFEAARQKLHEHPHSEPLLHCLTFALDGLLLMSGLPEEEKGEYLGLLAGWYQKLSESPDSKVRDSANYMRASRALRDGDYGKAQEILDRMPDRETLVGGMADKRMLQINLHLCRGETAEAVRELQNALLAALTRVQMLLFKMVDAELTGGGIENANDIADRADRMTALFDLWEYNAFVAPLQVAGAKKDADACIRLLRGLLTATRRPWEKKSSPLFYRIEGTSDPAQMLPAILAELEQDAAYDFLRDREEFQELIEEYKGLIEQF